MDYPHYLKIENSSEPASNVLVKHHVSPEISMVVDVESDADGTRQKGVIRRILFPNSSVGQYNLYAPIVAKGEEFLDVVLAHETEASIKTKREAS